MRKHGIEEGRGAFVEGAWYIIADAACVGKRPVSVERFGTRLVLFRDERGALVAARARCPHRGADLGLGRVVDGAIECPYHGWRFDGHGACRAIPSLIGEPGGKARAAPAFPVLEQDGWALSYDEYQRAGAVELPRKFEVANSELRLKVVVDTWSELPALK